MAKLKSNPTVADQLVSSTSTDDLIVPDKEISPVGASNGQTEATAIIVSIIVPANAAHVHPLAVSGTTQIVTLSPASSIQTHPASAPSLVYHPVVVPVAMTQDQSLVPGTVKASGSEVLSSLTITSKRPTVTILAKRPTVTVTAKQPTVIVTVAA